MKRILLLLFAFCMTRATLNAQQTSLTVDCQNPGWLSNLIPYVNQQSVRNLKVSGYINVTDIEFIKSLNKNYNLCGVIDLEECDYVKSQSNTSLLFQKLNSIQKLIMPKNLTELADACFNDTKIDTLVIFGNVSTLTIGQGVLSTSSYANVGCLYLHEGLKNLYIPHLAKKRRTELYLPSTLETIGCLYPYSNHKVHCSSMEPGNIRIQENKSNPFSSGVIYVPKGTTEKYKKSIFSKLTIIEDIALEGIEFQKHEVSIYIGDTISIPTSTVPSDALHQERSYDVSDSSIISLTDSCYIIAKNYGQSYVYVKSYNNAFTDSCLVEVYEHTTGVELQENIILKIGDKINIDAKTLPLGTSDGQIEYRCDDVDVATIDENGIIKAKKKGTCVITATSVDGGFSAQCEVEVVQPVECLSISQHEMKLKIEETGKLYVTLSPDDANNKKVIWSSSDASVATVDESGTVTAVNSGEAWIKAVSDDNPEACDSCKVTVTQAVSGIELDITECTLNKIGQTIQLTAKVLPENATNKNVNWKSSNESVCFVSNGKVVAVGFGTAVIIATTEEGGFMAICTVKVEEASTLKGDVNTDGKVDISDVVAIINTMAGDTTFKATSDVNNDGKTDISDVVSVINIMAGATE